jgi:hypothetical protein
MTTFQSLFVSTDIYNQLPHISDVADVPTEHRNDLEDLLALLVKHNVQDKVCVRLIHKHFDIHPGEIITIKKLEVPSHGAVSVLRPAKVESMDTNLYPLHFFVDSSTKRGQLQPYEYSATPLPDIKGFEPFFVEFCQLVIERELEHKFGLKISGEAKESDSISWTEFEFPQDRGTI